MSFKSISEQAPAQGKTVPYTLPLRSKHGPGVLHVEHLGESNHAFWHDALAQVAINVQQNPTGQKKRRNLSAPAMAAAVASARNEKREIVIKHAVRHLENIFHDDGRPATDEDIGPLIWALPADVFDDLFQFCENPANFRDTVIEGDPKAVAGE